MTPTKFNMAAIMAAEQHNVVILVENIMERFSSFKSYNPDHIRFTGYTTNTARRQPTTGNQNGDLKPEVRYIAGLDWVIREIPVATPTFSTTAEWIAASEPPAVPTPNCRFLLLLLFWKLFNVMLETTRAQLQKSWRHLYALLMIPTPSDEYNKTRPCGRCR